MTSFFLPSVAHLKNKTINICWLRRDVRLHDHPALSNALKIAAGHTLLLFIFDQQILASLEDKKDRRVYFLYQQLKKLNQSLNKKGSSLLVAYGKPKIVFQQLMQRLSLHNLHYNEDYEPYAVERDQQIQQLLEDQKIPTYAYKDHLIFAPNEILKADNTPYTIYTPYSKQYIKKLLEITIEPFSVMNWSKLLSTHPLLPFPSLFDIGFHPPLSFSYPAYRLNADSLCAYEQRRDHLADEGSSSYVGIYLRFGCVSIRELTTLALLHSRCWLNQLIWRNFYFMILHYFPKVVTHAFKAKYDTIPWSNNEDYFIAWCKGKTGFPLVDAGMRQLNATGMMHNRSRMVAANFLVKLLGIDWRWGEAYFAEKLLDYDLALNNGNWQWAAGSGCDAAPYFRIFNPTRQLERFDPEDIYVKRWVVEYGLPSYPTPIVCYKKAKENTLNLLKHYL